MNKKNIGYIGWLLIMIAAFWGGRLTAPVKVRVEKVPGEEKIIYRLTDMPTDLLVAHLASCGIEIFLKEEVEKIKSEKQRIEAQEHLIWQSGYKAGYSAGYGNGYAR